VVETAEQPFCDGAGGIPAAECQHVYLPVTP
jgi:hypothetical protein